MEVKSVTAAVPVLNGGKLFTELLDALNAQTNASGVEFEVLIVDSGSTDGSVDAARGAGARVIEIEKRDFQHGRTRNLLASEARGDVVAFLTQDAVPAGPGWLDAVADSFAAAPDVALAFGPHIARPEHSPSIQREMVDHFKSWGDGERIDVQQLEQNDEALAAYRAFPGQLQFFSDVNGAVAKSAWHEIPYREVPYAEDQLLGREMIEAGHAKVFNPAMAVIHSHDYSMLGWLRRYFDEYRSLREVLGHVEPASSLHWARAVVGLTRRDREFLRAEGVGGSALALATLRAVRHHCVRGVGSVLGSRADKLPARVRKVLSAEGRDSFEPQEPLIGCDS